MPELTVKPKSVMFYVLLFLETNHNRGQLDLLYIVSHNKLGVKTSLVVPCGWVTDTLVSKFGHECYRNVKSHCHGRITQSMRT